MITIKDRILPWVIVLSAALFFSYELMQLHMLNAISPFLLKDLHLNATQFSYLCSTYLLADVIFLMPAGIILDRVSNRKIILFALAICILGTFGFAFSQSLLTACICHFFSGIGNAFCFLSCMMLISNWFPKERQAFVIGIVITIGMLGGVISQYPFSMLAHAVSWRNALIIDGIIGIAILALIYTFVKDSPSFQKRLSENKHLSIREGYKQAIFNKGNISAGLYTGLMNLPIMILGAVWGSLFLTQIHGLALAKASFVASMICFGTIFGSSMVGYAADTLGRKKPIMILGALSSLICFSLILYPPFHSTLYFALLFFLLGICSSSQVLGYPLITENNPKEITGTAMGIAAVIIMGLPAIIQPLTGILMDFAWSGAMFDGAPLYDMSSYFLAFLIFPLGFIISIFLSLIVVESQEKKVHA